MMIRRLFYPISIAILAVVAGWAILWGFSALRRIDGRSASAWLAYASHASRATAYHARGITRVGSTQATFDLAQSANGQYRMQTVDTRGRACEFGFDGRNVWCNIEGKRSATTITDLPAIPIGAASRIIGIGQVAGRSVVHMSVRIGQARKKFAIDRQTGVILAMQTSSRNRVTSEMQVKDIAYRSVRIDDRTNIPASMHSATDARVTKAVGGIIRPRRLPAGMTERGVYLGPCPCCGRPMAALHYSDGLSTLTLFEMPVHESCMQKSGCGMVQDNEHIAATRTVNGIVVTAVGTVDVSTMNRMVNALQ